MTPASDIVPELFVRSKFPDFLDLPWGKELGDWTQEDGVVQVERGLSRHEVVFVFLDEDIFVIKELPGKLGRTEYQTLKMLKKLNLPVVTPVGYGFLRRPTDDEDRSVVITRYLDFSLPYRSLFTDKHLERYRIRLLDALASLLVNIHLKGVFWGDISLSNVLFKRDAGTLEAYMVDAETTEIHDSISDTKRNYDLSIMVENIAGELMDLSILYPLPDTFDIFTTGEDIRERYEKLWAEINDTSVFERGSSVKYCIQDRVRKLNELGFSVDEVSIVPAEEGRAVKVRPVVTDQHYHRNFLHSLTGLVAGETQSRLLLNEIRGVQGQMAEKQNRSVPMATAAYNWLNNNYQTTLDEFRNKYRIDEENIDLLELYCQVIEHKWLLSEARGEDVGMGNAVIDYLTKFENTGTIPRKTSPSVQKKKNRT